jgi:effector-binding domain-containing protein
MISIGDFARLGRVSVRLLRHYDTIGLLRPGHVDPDTGYRYYRRSQLRAMLRLRQAELQAEILDGRHRLDRVQARLRLIDAEDTMTHPDVIIKTVPAAAVVGLTATAASATQEDVGPVVGPMYPVIMQLLAAAGAAPVGPSIAYYTPAPEVSEDALRVYVTFPVAADSVPGLERVEIPAAEVASAVYRGSMAGVDAAYQLLHAWVRDHDFTDTGRAREVYLECPDDTSEWITEIQVEFAGR